jgi:regulator of nucleoside diphosphate kinase
MDIRGVPPSIVVTKADYARLSNLAEARGRAPLVRDYLAGELDRARVVDDDQVGPNIVTMHSRFVFKDESTGEARTVSLVYPGEEDIDEGRISILTPVGAALLGLSEGQSIEWETRNGESRTLTVLRLLSQPSASPNPLS